MTKRDAGTLPRNTVPNPKEQVHAIMLNSVKEKSEEEATMYLAKEDDNEEPITIEFDLSEAKQ